MQINVRQLVLGCGMIVGLLLGSVVVFLLSGTLFTWLYSILVGQRIESYSVVEKVRWAVATAVPVGLLYLLWRWLRRHVEGSGAK